MATQRVAILQTCSPNEDGEAAAPFVAVPVDRIEALRPRALAALEAMRGLHVPQASISIGSAWALDDDGLERLGIEPPPFDEPRVVNLDPDMLEAVGEEHWRDADLVRVNFHEDGGVWLTILPKYGDAYEACLPAGYLERGGA